VADLMPLLTLPSEQKDFVDWRRGRRYFAVWAIDLDGPLLRQASADIRETLGDYWLPGYVRQPHLTVGLCGFPVASAGPADDYGFAQFATQRRALIAAAPARFDVEIGAPDSFVSAAYFSVRDLEGGLEKLHHILGGELEKTSFVPHVTFALYRSALPLPAVLAELQARNPLAPSRLTVSKVAWMVYEAAVIGGPLFKLGEFDFETGRFEVLAGNLFERVFD